MGRRASDAQSGRPYGEYAIVGARGRVQDAESAVTEARRWGAAHAVDVLLLDAEAVFGRAHIDSAVLHALRAATADTMIARSPSMETLLYATGQHQVSTALRIAGVRRGTSRLVVVSFGSTSIEGFLEAMGWTPDDTVLDARGKPLARLGISATERRTVPADRQHDLALERVALVDIIK